MTDGIGTLNEGSAHAALKRLYAEPGDAFEVSRDGFVIDLVKRPGTEDEVLVEIQTGSFAAMGNKLDRLLAGHRMLLVHPIALVTVLERRPTDGPLRRRRSPVRGSIYSLFDELVSIPTLLDHPNLSLEVVLVHQVKKQVEDPNLRRRRGGFRTVDRHIEDVLDRQRFDTVDDLARLLPSTLPERFTTADIAEHSGCRRDEAQKMAFCLRTVGLIDRIDRRRSGAVYELRAARSP